MESPRFYRTAAGASGLKNREMKPQCSSSATGICLFQLNLNLSLKNSVCCHEAKLFQYFSFY